MDSDVNYWISKCALHFYMSVFILFAIGTLRFITKRGENVREHPNPHSANRTNLFPNMELHSSRIPPWKVSMNSKERFLRFLANFVLCIFEAIRLFKRFATLKPYKDFFLVSPHPKHQQVMRACDFYFTFYSL